VWFPKLAQTIDGFLRMAKRNPNALLRTLTYPVAAAAIYGTTFPGEPDALLRLPSEPSEPPAPSSSAGPNLNTSSPTNPASAPAQNAAKKWPLMIFSHGVGCSRLMYSAYCGEMASRGYVCCAIEHRDGTSPSSRIVTADGRAKNLDWLQWSDLVWPELEVQPTDDTCLRHEQIKMRLAEIEEVIKAMRKIGDGENITRTSINSPNFDWNRWRSALDTDRPVMAGHSLGGSAAIAAAADSRFDFSSVIAFDPAIQRLEPWSASISSPLLVVNSEEFVKSTDFERLVNLLKFAKESYVFSIAGATHPSFSDVFLILPSYINRLTGLKTQPERVISISVAVVVTFLGGRVGAARAQARAVKGSGTGEKVASGALIFHEL